MFCFDVKEIESTSHSNDGYFQQTSFWTEFKEAHGWKCRKFSVHWEFAEKKAEATAEVSVMLRSFCRGFFTFAYVPLFPGLPFEGTDAHSQNIEFSNFLSELGMALKAFLPANTLCIRFDPAVGFDSPEERDEFVQGMKVISFADRLSLKKSRVDIQPPDSTRIDLLKTEEEILAGMKTKWRYNVNLSARKGVEIECVKAGSEGFCEKLDIFYELYKVTAERDGIAIHSKSYYEDLLKKSAEETALGKDVPCVSLYLARHEQDYLGAIITLFSRTESIYLYGCSSNVKRNLMPNFLLQWTAMKDAKSYGSSYYDMYGMPPTDDENHPMHGLYLFKTGFGGQNIHRIGSFDVPVSAFYSVYKTAESLRAFWHKKVLKRIRGR